MELAQVRGVALGTLDRRNDQRRALPVVGDLVAAATAAAASQHDQHSAISKLADEPRRGTDAKLPPHLVA
jgi:hypothetical protein